ncbi:MAG: hypothetical protein V4734_08775 [Terriglobus sp.]
MDKTILIVTAMDGAENLARTISRDADAIVEIARSRRAALARLRRGPVTALLLDASLSEAEMTTSDVLWQNAHGAVPLEIPLASLGASSVVRLLRSLLEGRKQAETQGRRIAATAVAEELQSTLTSLLLESDLLLRDKALTPNLVAKARVVRELADNLRVRLRSESGTHGAYVPDEQRPTFHAN